jgi:hypothetical protein
MTISIQETLQQLARESYEVATAKGWHENDELDENGTPTVRQLLTWCALFHTEVTEYEQVKAHYYLDGEKPCGKITELADVAIRVWDAMGRLGFETESGGIRCGSQSVRHAIDVVIEQARIRGVHNMITLGLLNDLVDKVFDEANSIGYNLESFVWFIKNKMAFNKSRPYRHGGRLA